MRQPPRLSLHKRTGVYFVKFQRKFTYFTKDPGESQGLYVQWLSDVWGPVTAAVSSGPTVETRLLELSELYLTHVRLTMSHKLMADYRGYLKPALRFKKGAAAGLRVTDVNAQFLNALQHSMLADEYKPRTVNHTLKAVVRMIRWAEDQELIPATSLPKRVNLVPVSKPQPKALPPSVVVDWLRDAGEKDSRLVPWLALNYLAAMRPSELPRLIRGEGEKISEGVVAITGKSTHKTGEPRYVLLSEEARGWLEVAEPCWKRWESYSSRVRSLSRYGGPRRLRSWAATHLRQQGVPLPDVRVILGHAESGSIVHYVESDFSAALSGVDRISVRPVVPDRPA